ncbi:transcriptional repressor [candidate division KSB1 bacterium]|nr:transcriptional repressor [candidate division KSB1 bacterium]
MFKIKDLLIQNGIKPTFQRIKILEYLQKNDTHPTVETIYSDLYKKVPTLSKATIYNTLDIFRKHSLVNVLTISETEMRYEFNHGPHHHFQCRVCGKIVDVEVECPHSMKPVLEGYILEEVHSYFKGVCRNCNTAQSA